jgi:hypothetical protein
MSRWDERMQHRTACSIEQHAPGQPAGASHVDVLVAAIAVGPRGRRRVDCTGV